LRIRRHAASEPRDEWWRERLRAVSSNKRKKEQLREKRDRKIARERMQAFLEGRLGLETGLPRGALAANVNRQNATCIVKPFYRDIEFTCVDCGTREIWTAAQQKWWYEEVGGLIGSKAVRCRACRAKADTRAHADDASARSSHELTRLRDHLQALGARPDDPAARAELEAALYCKWEGIKIIAGRALAGFGGEASRTVLRKWLSRVCEDHPSYEAIVQHAAGAVAAVARADDLEWLIDLYFDRSEECWKSYGLQSELRLVVAPFPVTRIERRCVKEVALELACAAYCPELRAIAEGLVDDLDDRLKSKARVTLQVLAWIIPRSERVALIRSGRAAVPDLLVAARGLLGEYVTLAIDLLIAGLAHDDRAFRIACAETLKALLHFDHADDPRIPPSTETPDAADVWRRWWFLHRRDIRIERGNGTIFLRPRRVQLQRAQEESERRP
jgi:hypothetical protein